MPQYAILIHAAVEKSEPSPDDRSDHDDQAQELIASGAMVAAFAMESPDQAVSIRASGETLGPFQTGAEVIVGFCVVEAPDLDAALEIGRANPSVRQGGGVEVCAIEGGFVRGAESSAG